MKKNIILFLIISPILFGCTAEYNLKIINDDYYESVNGFDINTNSLKKTVEEELRYNTFALNSQVADIDTDEKIDGVSYYNKKLVEKDSLIGINYNFRYNKENYYDSYIANQCYKKYSFINNNSTYVISTDDTNKCMDNVDTLTIHINTNHKVKKSNADEVDGNDYYWNINKSNSKNKPIYFEYYKDKYIFDSNKLIKIIVSVLIFIGGILIVSMVMIRKKNNNNKI